MSARTCGVPPRRHQAHHVLGAHVLKGAQVRPRAIGQRQIREVAHPDLVGLGWARLVEQQVRRAPLPVGRIGGARDEGLGLQGPPVVAAQPGAQGLTAHPIAFFPPFNRQASGAITPFVVVEHGEHFRFPGRFAGPRRRRCLPLPPGVLAAGHHVQHLA